MAPDQTLKERWHRSELLLIGGSAGSFKIIFRLVKNFSPTLNKVVVIVMHRKKNFASEIEKLFTEGSRMSFKEVSDKDIINNNTIYIAPANYHTLIESSGVFSLDVSDALWFSKPSIDVTFESAAESFGSRCIAVLLSGANQDGACGLLKLKSEGALTIVQDPEDAEVSQMPQEAININAADYVLSTSQIFELLKS